MTGRNSVLAYCAESDAPCGAIRDRAAIAPYDYELDFHPLKGDRKGGWAVSVSGSWRVTFKFVGKDANFVDYEDYH
ncbi:MAG: type II toxin-antitoxin system RelE/ParE family toxin [Acidobacteria bacterium]|nr:type II toxin-antitoxin system RelE/ParE family toxin [Acidobacteriota bacterium]